MSKIEHRIDVFLSAQKTFGNIIKALLESQEAQESAELSSYLERILGLHHQVHSDCQELIIKYKFFHCKFSDATREKGEIISGKSLVKLDRGLIGSQDSLQKYFVMKEAGRTPEEVYRAAKADGIEHYLDLLFLMRKVFGFSLMQAKNVAVAVEQASG